MVNRRFIVLALAVFTILGIAAVVVYSLNTSPGGQSSEIEQPVTNDPAQPGGTESEVTEHNVDPFLGNLEVLFAVYSPQEYLFINQSVLEFASAEFGKDSDLEINTTSFGQRTDGSYRFSVNDRSVGQHMFYVIITRVNGGQLKVDKYL